MVEMISCVYERKIRVLCVSERDVVGSSATPLLRLLICCVCCE